MYILDYIYRL